MSSHNERNDRMTIQTPDAEGLLKTLCNIPLDSAIGALLGLRKADETDSRVEALRQILADIEADEQQEKNA